MILEDVFQMVLRGLLIIQGWSYHRASREALFYSPQEGDCLLMGLANIVTKVTLSARATCVYSDYSVPT